MRSAWLTSLLIVVSYPALATTPNCPNMNMDGTWKSDGSNILFGSSETYRISQKGCYLLISATSNHATWKIDLSGERQIQVPSEVVQANLDGDSPAAARNMKNLVFSLKPVLSQEGPYQSYYMGEVTTEASFEGTASVPLSFRVRLGGQANIIDNSGCPSCSSGPTASLTLDLREVTLRDIDGGLPSRINKSSFIEGANKVLQFLMPALWYRLPVVRLVKE